jgi:isoamyl acetate esterase
MVALAVRMRPVIVLFGDSITQQGFGWDGAVGWASLLSATYSRRADVLNRGYSGYNTRHGLDLLPHIFGSGGGESSSSSSSLSSSFKEPPNVLFVTIFFGANDAALPGERQHVPIDEYGANLETMISYIQNHRRTTTATAAAGAVAPANSDRDNTAAAAAATATTAKDNADFETGETTVMECTLGSPTTTNTTIVILFTPPPVDVDAWYKSRGGTPNDPNRRNDRANQTAKEYGSRVKQVAATYNNKNSQGNSNSVVSVLDVFDLLGGNSDSVETYSRHLRDGVHLSESGNRLVYEGFMKLLDQEHPHLLPMLDGEGRYGISGGVPLEEKLWGELC